MATDYSKTPDVTGHVGPQERIKEIFTTLGAGGADTPYDNSDSDIVATTVKGALDELASRVAALEP